MLTDVGCIVLVISTFLFFSTFGLTIYAGTFTDEIQCNFYKTVMIINEGSTEFPKFLGLRGFAKLFGEFTGEI